MGRRIGIAEKNDAKTTGREIDERSSSIRETYARGAWGIHPFGGYLTHQGNVVHVAAEVPGDDHPRALELVGIFKDRLCSLAASNGVIAAAIVINVSVLPPGFERKYDAIQISLDHIEGYTAEVFYPYTIDKNVVSYLRLFAQKGSGDILLGG